MARNRYILCLLFCGLMLYYALPRLSITISAPEGIFSISWLMLALFVIAGNLAGILYNRNKRPENRKRTPRGRIGKKARHYLG